VTILVIDTAGRACSVLLWKSGQVLAQQSTSMMRGHAEALAPMVASVFASAGMTARDCDKFAVTTGPGSFTGLRVGVSMVRALAMATERPAIGVNSFQAWAATAVARALEPADRILVALDSRRGTAFSQMIAADGKTAIADAAEYALHELEQQIQEAQKKGDIMVCGDSSAIPDHAALTLDLACVAVIASEQVDAVSPRPFYLRPPDAKPMAAHLGRPSA